MVEGVKYFATDQGLETYSFSTLIDRDSVTVVGRLLHFVRNLPHSIDPHSAAPTPLRFVGLRAASVRVLDRRATAKAANMFPTGYLSHTDRNRKCEVIVDELRAPVIKQMYEKVAHDGWSGRKLFYWLKDDIRFRTKHGKPLTLSNIYIILKSTFYYGEFEYPKGSGTWYTGKHAPIITKDLYLQVQGKLTSDSVRVQDKEFAFTKMITCGLCGSGITADEKFKKLKDGTTNRYVYYGCTKFRDKNCPCGYVREEELIEQLASILDTVSLDEIGMKDKIKTEIEAHNEFQESVLGQKSMKVKVREVDIRNYAKHILRKRPVYEKREILCNLRSKLVLTEKKITLLKPE